MKSNATDQKLTVAVLGPFGTYTHEAAYGRFGTCAEYIEKTTIRDVFDALSSTAHLCVVPQENTIFGSVIETYDVLRTPGAGFVRGETTLQIQHCLLVRQGVKLHDIQKVMSHEQALGQCRGFIANHLPSAALVKTPSTAAAARALLDSPANCAAICSKLCATLFDGLSVLCEGIQDGAVNLTRFYIVAKNEEVLFPLYFSLQPQHALIQISVKIPLSDTQMQTADIIRLLSALQLNIARIDRRPSIENLPFHDVYFVELKETEVDIEHSWAQVVNRAAERVKQAGGNVGLLGIW